MEQLLRSFNGDVHSKEALIEFIHQYIDNEGLKRIYSGKPVGDVADARELIDGAFEYLTELYAAPTPQKEITNEAR